MRRLLSFAVIAILTISISTCSDSGTGPNPGNDNDNNGGGGETTTYTVSVESSSSDAGTVSPSGENTYDEGEEIELQANPNDGYIFTEWSGDIESTDNPNSLTVDQDYNVAANFELKSYELTVNTEGEGTVSEEVLEQKSKEYEHGTVVELTANSAEGYRFVEWKGDVTGTDNPAQITVDNSKDVTAVFEKKNYALTVNTEGDGAVSEEVVQQKSTDYEYGTVVELTANAAEGYEFVKWKGANTTADNPIRVTVDSPKEVTAVFEKKNFSVTLNTTGEGSIAEEVVQAKSYDYGTQVRLTANPAEGWQFVEWTGDITGSENPAQITVDNPKEVTAVFEKKTFTLSVETSGEGSVSLNPDQAEYEYGTQVELTASASGDWAFDKWQGDITGTNNSVTITMEANKSITALFENTLFAGGAGTEANPFQISTVDELQAINQYTSAHYIQISDIDASETENWNGGRGFKPIGDDIIEFSGTYKGGGYQISNLIIDRPNTHFIGIFSRTNNSLITNIHLVNIVITGDSYTGGIVGKSYESQVKNVFLDGTITGGTNVGGLIGKMNFGFINNVRTNVRTNVDINASSEVGGLIGSTLGAGGAEVEKSSSSGSINASGDKVGGLIGLFNANGIKISSSFSKSTVIGVNRVGGLVGESIGGSIIYNSYAQGDVDGNKNIGGLVGLNRVSSSVELSYASGRVNGQSYVGGIIGTHDNDDSTVNSSYWDTESSNQTTAVGRGNTDGTTGLTTSEMTGSSAEENMPDFDWSEIWVTTDNYPVLQWE